MKQQWVPPPGWPPPPYAGWSPPPGWQPDTSWPEPPATWEYWQSTPTLPVASRTKRGAAVAVVGAALACVGAFGTWITISTRLGQLASSSGFQRGHDGPFVLALALVVLGIAIPRIRGIRIPLWLDILAIAVAAILAVICVADTADVHHRVDKILVFGRPYLSGGVGIGLKLALVGSLLSLAGSVAAIDVRRTAPPAVRI